MTLPESFPLSISRTGHRLRLERVTTPGVTVEWTLVQDPVAPLEHPCRIAVGPGAAAALMETVG